MATLPYASRPMVKEDGFQANIVYAEMGPNPAYSVDRMEEDAPYFDEPADNWAVKLSEPGTVEGVPDARRTEQFPLIDHHPVTLEGYARRDVSTAQRHTDEQIQPNGIPQQPGFIKTYAPFALATPSTDGFRWTMDMSPLTYLFERPFDQGAKGLGRNQVNGSHFSMADHRRDYEILGMAPAPVSRNTYRTETPPPWDTNYYDAVPQYEPPYLVTEPVMSPMDSRNTYRLG